MRKDAIEHLVRAPAATFRTELVALCYDFGNGTVAFKNGDPAGTRADVHYLPDLGGDGPHQRVQFWGARADRDALPYTPRRSEVWAKERQNSM